MRAPLSCRNSSEMCRRWKCLLSLAAPHLDDLQIAENSQGRDGKYALRFTARCLYAAQFRPLDIPFLFYNDTRKRAEMASLSRQRDELMAAVGKQQRHVDASERRARQLKLAYDEVSANELKLRRELLRRNVPTAQLTGDVRILDDFIELRMKMRANIEKKPIRKCGLSPAPRDADVIGNVAHLATVVDDGAARVLSWHLISDMECVVTATTAKAMELYKDDTRDGRQELLALDSIYRKALPNWKQHVSAVFDQCSVAQGVRALPHVKHSAKWKPQGNPLILVSGAVAKGNYVVFSMLLGDTIIVDTLQDATAYRAAVSGATYCPTLLTRDGHRMRSNGKFGGASNRAWSLERLRGVVFAAPLPLAHAALSEDV
ncbi:PREDICTED: LOW QUALITY PROTEIN: structural maintenance of chromosomes flexible hinge domain-containing protein 1-like, partial [Priapulus caudatus]|uniref:LOW QUALITY PROTEIN: structural maintenance of chromosomes flexible hinge domain-containing protein 1-like n=1 Tax=Priapulus caudatus TaxID=37621 RepID=A0ABM1EY27_PRICU